jgi:hypothetical protein
MQKKTIGLYDPRTYSLSLSLSLSLSIYEKNF